jgi:hypothetical protein
MSSGYTIGSGSVIQFGIYIYLHSQQADIEPYNRRVVLTYFYKQPLTLYLLAPGLALFKVIAQLRGHASQFTGNYN